MKINSYFLKLSGKVESPQELEIGKNYHLKIEGSITSQTDMDNHDGSFDRAYKLEPVMIEGVDEKGEAIKFRDARSKGQLLRGTLYREWRNSNLPIDFDTYYGEKMDEIISERLKL